MTTEHIKRWQPVAEALESTQISLSRPIDVFLGEAIDVAQFHERYWATLRDEDGRIKRPGLELAMGGQGSKALLTEHTATELRSLQAAASEADIAYRHALNRPTRAPTQEARRILSRITGALRWLLDDEVEERADTQLANLDARHRNATTNDAIASALEAYASLAHQLRDRLTAFEIFDVGWIDDARALASALREASGISLKTDEVRDALRLRDGFFVLLRQRMRVVRQAAEFVFMDEPDIVVELASSYDRRRRMQRERDAENASSEASPSVDDVQLEEPAAE